jgi:hypothetical protein
MIPIGKEIWCAAVGSLPDFKNMLVIPEKMVKQERTQLFMMLV